MKNLIALFILSVPMSLFSQNIDVDLLRSIHDPEPLSSDGFFRVVADANIYVITGAPITMAVAGLASHNYDVLRNAAVMAAGTAVTYGIALG